jgi:hypothetical protein
MNLRTLLLGATLMTVVISGCLSNDSKTDDVIVTPVDPLLRMPALLPDGTEAPMTLSFTGCSEHLGIFPAPADEFAGYLPEGFEPVPFDGVPGMVVMTGIAYSCTAGNDSVTELLGGLAVTVPEEYQIENASFYSILLGGFSDREDLVAIYEAWHMGGTIALGTTSVGTMGPGNPLVRAGHAVGSSDGFTVHMYSTVPSSMAATEEGKGRMFVINWESQSLQGAFDVHFTASMGTSEGPATLLFDGAIGGIAPQPAPGFAFHYTGEEYGYHFSYVPLRVEEPDHEHTE